MSRYYVYILASRRNGTLYVGVTNDIQRRYFEHKNHVYENSFTKKYRVNRLVWFETMDSIIEAIAEEKRIKRWRRNWKLQLIEKANPEWRNLEYDWKSNEVELIAEELERI